MTITIFIYDNIGGAFPLKCQVRKSETEIEIFNDALRIRLPIEKLMMIIAEEQHG